MAQTPPKPKCKKAGSKAGKPFSLVERARCYQKLIEQPGWMLLEQAFSSHVPTAITDQDSRERFLYEATRAQVIQEIFKTPERIIHQAEQTWQKSALSEPLSNPSSAQ
ncbi:MAG: hypothetical protein SFZ03_04850 [Candidatus Melainabacteria bacterium]|nr:hypothetical protein [Candidatus Melainabacteria bacterium]